MTIVANLLGFGTKTRIVPQEDYAGFTLLRSDEELQIDCVEEANPSHDAEPTDLPVEEGADITEHVRLKPDSLTLRIVHTNDPLDDPIPGRPAIDQFRADDAYRKLVNWEFEKVLLAVVLPDRTFENMIITNISPQKTSVSGAAFVGTVSFREIVRVETSQVALTASGSMAPKKKAGLKKMAPADPVKRASALKRLSSWIGGD